MTLYLVTLQRVLFGYATVEVDADTSQEAEEMAPKVAFDQIGPHDWDTPKMELLESDLTVVGEAEPA